MSPGCHFLKPFHRHREFSLQAKALSQDHLQRVVLFLSLRLCLDVVNDFTDPNLVLYQNHFIAQVNTLCTNTTVTRANQLWICGFANAS